MKAFNGLEIKKSVGASEPLPACRTTPPPLPGMR